VALSSPACERRPNEAAERNQPRVTGIRVQVVEARSGVRERLRTEGLDTRLGGIDRFTSVAGVVYTRTVFTKPVELSATNPGNDADEPTI
jgi:hypothetical protein